MIRKGSAVWNGGIKEGRGTVSTETGTLSDTQYSFSSRFESGTGTNPEELLGAAHAGCFSMALSLVLGNAGLTADYIRTTAAVTLDQADGGFAITRVHLDVHAKVPGATPDSFTQAANDAKVNCPVSKLFKADITMDATLDA
jgi:osmotically inducible protein OsmC